VQSKSWGVAFLGGSTANHDPQPAYPCPARLGAAADARLHVRLGLGVRGDLKNSPACLVQQRHELVSDQLVELIGVQGDGRGSGRLLLRQLALRSLSRIVDAVLVDARPPRPGRRTWRCPQHWPPWCRSAHPGRRRRCPCGGSPPATRRWVGDRP